MTQKKGLEPNTHEIAGFPDAGEENGHINQFILINSPILLHLCGPNSRNESSTTHRLEANSQGVKTIPNITQQH